jgi:hypothetical protein
MAVVDFKMVRAAGFEPADDSSQTVENELVSISETGGYTQIRAQISDSDRRSLSRVVEAWPRLNDGLRLAILAIVDADRGEGGAR